jgi:hypothetical protein
LHTYSLDDEARRCSEFSPSQVNESEQLHRLLFDSESYNPETNEISTSAITTQDLMCKGWSLYRNDSVNEHTIRSQADTQKAKIPDKRIEAYVATFRCVEAREIQDDDGIRNTLIIDDGNENDPSHAMLFVVPPNKVIAKKVQGRLRNLLQKNIQSLDTLKIERNSPAHSNSECGLKCLDKAQWD